MRFHQTKLAGVYYIEAEPSSDHRGSVNRAYSVAEFEEAGLSFLPQQVNLTRNPHRHTLRGMHYQEHPRAEAKLVRVVRGSIFDVAIDLRADSPTYLQWVGYTLDWQSMNAFFLPEGCAHGFLTLEPDTDVLYQLSRVFEPGWDKGARWSGAKTKRLKKTDKDRLEAETWSPPAAK